MEALSEIELRIIQQMLVKEYGPRSAFLRQLSCIGVENRNYTGRGVFISLHMPESIPRADPLNDEVTEGYPTVLPAPADLVGFTLFIRDGHLSFLEGYTFGGDVEWPGELSENWLFPQPAGVTKQKGR